MSIPPITPTSDYFPLMLFTLALSSVSSDSEEPPPVLRAEEILSLMIRLCFDNTFDYFLVTSSLLLKVPRVCDTTSAISFQTLFFSSLSMMNSMI